MAFFMISFFSDKLSNILFNFIAATLLFNFNFNFSSVRERLKSVCY
ncbi:hypothetical protein BN133_3469 [Cronobacter dublinensis 582]|nr:hypothetical protein BN133_3469 [Cronobacter dublinensis 582]